MTEPQAGRLANDLLRERLAKEGYYEAETPGLWKHASHPIQFVLVVDDFFVEYVGREHAEHLANVLKKYHTISEDWTAKKFVEVNLEWNYAGAAGNPDRVTTYDIRCLLSCFHR